MTIKNPSAKMFAAILAVVIAGATLYAQNSASTNENNTNTVTAPTESSAVASNTVPGTNFASNSISLAKPNHASGLPPAGGRMDINPRNGNPGKTLVALAAVLSPFLFAFGLPIAIIVTVFYFRHRQNKMVHETIRAMVERGVPVTPELIAGLNPRGFKVNIQGKWDVQRYRNRYLLPGLILTGVGIALIVTLPEHTGPVGLIILFIGFAFLIVWLVERKQNANDDRAATTGGAQSAERRPDNDPQPPKS